MVWKTLLGLTHTNQTKGKARQAELKTTVHCTQAAWCKAKKFLIWPRNTLDWIHQCRQDLHLERCLIHHLTRATKREIYPQTFFPLKGKMPCIGTRVSRCHKAWRQMSRQSLRAEHLYKDIFSFSSLVIYPVCMTHSLLRSTVTMLSPLHRSASFMPMLLLSARCEGSVCSLL